MPWHWEPMKDVVTDEMLRGAGNRHRSADLRMEESARAIPVHHTVNKIVV